MIGRCCIGVLLAVLTGCSVRRAGDERIPVTAERIAELKQLCYSAGPFKVVVPHEWRPVKPSAPGFIGFSASHTASDVFLYAHAVAKSTTEPLTAFIASDIDSLVYQHPNLIAAEGYPIAIPAEGKQAAVRYLEGDSFGGRSIVAYIDEGNYVGIIGLSAHRHEVVDSAEGAFQRVVQSYRRV